jgi:hypothetical protein
MHIHLLLFLSMPKSTRNRRNRARNTSAPYAQRMPQITANPVNSQTCRFGGNLTVSGATESVITISAQELMFYPGAIATSSTTYYSIAQAIRLKSVDVWCTPVINGSSGAAVSTVSVGVAWYSGNQAATGRVQTDTSLSYASPCFVHATPERAALTSFWVNNGGNAAMFDLIVNATVAGNVTVFLAIDIHLDWVASNQSYSLLSKTSASTMTVGTMVYPPLDGPGGSFSRMALPAVS